MQRAASANVARCVGNHSLLRLPMHRGVLKTLLLRSRMLPTKRGLKSKRTEPPRLFHINCFRMMCDYLTRIFLPSTMLMPFCNFSRRWPARL